jgi:ABC-type phosphate transport system substrate-binding protein
VKKTFYKYLGKSSSRMKSIWLKRMLSGEGDPPQAFKSEEELLQKVMLTPGAVGFVATEKVNEQVKVLVVIEEK